MLSAECCRMRPSHLFHMVEVAGRTEENGEQREVVSRVEENTGRERSCTGADKIHDSAYGKQDQQRRPSHGQLSAVKHCEEKAGDPDASYLSLPARQSGIEESAKEQFLRQGRHQDSESRE